jgi:hypothetical protein
MKKTTLSTAHIPTHTHTPIPPYRALYLSCFSGISGNMFIGALLDAGLSEEAFRKMVSALPVSGYQLKIEGLPLNLWVKTLNTRGI